MAKRAGLPGADELFRSTDEADHGAEEGERAPESSARATSPSGATGRVKHDQKITVYFSQDELLQLEDANLTLRREHGIRIDRGRLVRLALAVALRDFAEHGVDSALLRELA